MKRPSDSPGVLNENNIPSTSTGSNNTRHQYCIYCITRFTYLLDARGRYSQRPQLLTGSDRVTALPALFTASFLVTTLDRAGRTAMALYSPSPHPAKAGFLLRWVLLLLATAPSLGRSSVQIGLSD